MFALYAYIFGLGSAKVKCGNIFYMGKFCSRTQFNLGTMCR
jgi:hypothetical protein